MKILKKNILYKDLPEKWKNIYIKIFAELQFDIFNNEPDYDFKSWKDEIEPTKKHFEQEYNGRLLDEGYSFVKYIDENNELQFGISRDVLEEYFYGS